MPHRTVLPGGDGSQVDARASLSDDERRGDEDDELAAGLAVLLLLEEPADDGDIAEDRHLADVQRGQPLGDAADDEAVAVFDQDLGFRLTLVDDRHAYAYTQRDIVPTGVVLHEYDHLDLGDDVGTDLLPDHGGEDIELEHRLLELDLGTRRAHRRVGDFFAEGDRGFGVLYGDDLRACERARLALGGERLQGKIDVVAARHQPEGDAAGRRALSCRARQGGKGQVDHIAAEREASGGRYREEVGEGQVGVVRRELWGDPARIDHGAVRKDDARARRHAESILRRHGLEALAYDRGVVVDVPRPRAAPLDADALVGVAVENFHPRLDLHLRQRHVEAFADELLDALDVSFVVTDEDAVGRL